MTAYVRLAVATALVGNLAIATADTGTAVIAVVAAGAENAAGFTFAGIPAGTIAAGETLRAGDLRPGVYTASASLAPPGLRLVDIGCDDDDSIGLVATATARFSVAAGETVTCTFSYGRQDIGEAPSSTVPDQADAPPADAEPPPETPPEHPGEPAEPAPPEDPSGCTPPDLVPREGVWMVANLQGTMVCGAMTMPLTPSTEPGTLRHFDCGWTLVASGFSDDTADITMRAADSSGRRYLGTVGASEGLPMTMDFQWDVHSETRISGQLHSQVAEQGVTCTMSRPFEMEFTGP